MILGVAVGAGLLGRAVVLDGAYLALGIRLALLMLLWLAMFAALGGVIHERRLELGFEPAHSPERRQRRDDAQRDRERDRLIDQVFGEFRAGRLHTAWQTIERHAQRSTSPPGPTRAWPTGWRMNCCRCCLAAGTVVRPYES